MNTNEKNNLNLTNENDGIVITEADDKKRIIELAHQQKAQFDAQRLEWRKADQKKDEEQLKLLIENGQIKKQLDDITKTVDALKYQAILNQEVSASGQQQPQKPRELTQEEKVNQILAEVIRERKEKAQEVRKQKKDNVFYL